MVLHPSQTELRELANSHIAAGSKRFFKTGEGEYGEGDVFLGIRVPQIRKLVAKYKRIELQTALEILRSEFHEERMFALLLLVKLFENGDDSDKASIYRAYLDNTAFINNWDLVDCSAHLIVGKFLLERDKKILDTMARSNDLWERRIAVIATFCFIKNGFYETTFRLAQALLNDKHDLIHKAVGWMLREVGNYDRAAEEAFLQLHYNHMPRTMLRYAIEKFPKLRREQYLKGLV